MITAGMATYPPRKSIVQAAIQSILPQIDRLYLWANEYPYDLYLPDSEKITLLTGPDVGDSGKFAGMAHADGYFFSLDDDMLYPDTYVEDHIAAMQRYNNQAIIGLHGRQYHRKVMSYYAQASRTKHWSKPQPEDERFTVLATCLTVFHTETIRYTLADFPENNMTDIFVALKAAKAGVPRIVRQHDVPYMRMHPELKQGKKGRTIETIFDTYRNNDARQTYWINQLFEEQE